MSADLEAELARLEEELKLALVETDPADEKDVILEVRQGVGGDEAALWAGDLYRMLTRYAERRGFKTETLSTSENEVGWREGDRVRGEGPGGVLGLQVRGRHAPRAACPGDRVPGADPHLDRNGGGHARGGGGRDRDRGEGPQDRRHALDRARGAEREHDRLRGPHHARPDRDRRRHAGREVAAPEPAEGDARAPRAPVRGRARPPAGGARRDAASRRSGAGSEPRRSAPTTSRRAGSPTTGSS